MSRGGRGVAAEGIHRGRTSPHTWRLHRLVAGSRSLLDGLARIRRHRSKDAVAERVGHLHNPLDAVPPGDPLFRKP